jgi:hypothetical protein
MDSSAIVSIVALVFSVPVVAIVAGVTLRRIAAASRHEIRTPVAEETRHLAASLAQRLGG